MCGVFYANDIVSRYDRIYDQDIESCDPYTWEQFSNRGTKERLSESIFLLFAPLM